MRLVIQRVKYARLSINEHVHAQINLGLLALVGIEEVDEQEDVDYIAAKLVNMRIFSDSDGKMNLSMKDCDGDLLLVSQFTLHASTRKGNRPSFIKAAKPEHAIILYQKCVAACEKELGKPIKSGVFGAEMQIELLNDGPVTILLDSRNRE